LPQEKRERKQKAFLAENDLWLGAMHPLPMQKSKAQNRLYIGEWIAFRGLTAADVARASGVNEGYLSLLIAWEKNGRPPNPTFNLIKRLAAAIGVPMAVLFEAPPTLSANRQIRPLSGLPSPYGASFYRPKNT